MYSGTLDLDGELLVEVTAAPGAGTLERLIDAVTMAVAASREERLAERLSAWFLPVVLVVAAAAGAAQWLRVGPAAGVLAALAVVVVSCPCALGLATPMALWAAVGNATRRHVLVRNGDAFAALAAKALTPRTEPEVSVSHLHVPLVSVREQAAIIVGRLRRQRTATFRALVSDAATTMVVIGRFLALLELFREGSVSFEQVAPLGDLTIRWTGSDDGDVDVRDEYDDHDDEVVVVEEGPGDSGEVLAEAEVFVEAEEIES